VLYDLHNGQPREESVIVNQTSHFRLTRFYLRGPKAGTAEVVLDGLTGMNDGMDRDAAGRIWLALFTEGSPVLTWLHAHAWVKPLFLRIPPKLLLREPRRTGVLVLSPDGRRPLYAAMYKGPLLTSIPSAVATPAGVYSPIWRSAIAIVSRPASSGSTGQRRCASRAQPRLLDDLDEQTREFCHDGCPVNVFLLPGIRAVNDVKPPYLPVVTESPLRYRYVLLARGYLSAWCGIGDRADA
jgi:hypothetical protein